VAAGAAADKWLREDYGIDIVAWVASVGNIAAPDLNFETLSRQSVDAHPVRCPDPKTAAAMTDLITAVRTARDSVGGIVSCVCRNVPAGIGEPVFDKLEALLAHAMLSIPATKGFEIGSGFAAARMRGSRHNDVFVERNGRLATATNHSGGVQGGISNGEPVVFRVAFKPPATIGLPQETVDYQGRPATLEARGRHDPCVVPRAVPIVEAMAALVIGDLILRQQARGR
jgi:chorismate synthase